MKQIIIKFYMIFTDDIIDNLYHSLKLKILTWYSEDVW